MQNFYLAPPMLEFGNLRPYYNLGRNMRYTALAFAVRAGLVHGMSRGA